MFDPKKAEILRAVFKAAPFSLVGGLQDEKKHHQGLLSCAVCTKGRHRELALLLSDFSRQILERRFYEVIVLDDSETDECAKVVAGLGGAVPVKYFRAQTRTHAVGDLRNETVQLSEGEYILFLDDDTRLLQRDFLKRAVEIMALEKCDVLVPKAAPLFGLVRGCYDYLDEYSYANRCCLYTREALIRLGGFQRGIYSYEDIELGIRVTLSDMKVRLTDELKYLHPPLFFSAMNKPFSIGQSIFQLRRRYSFLVWLLVYLNALRFFPLGLWPFGRNRQLFKISLGVLLGPFLRTQYRY